MKTVKQVAELSGVTVRTLHHYDEIGLLRPSERSEAGYRLYSRADLDRLQEILGWRELEFPLAEIAALIDDAAYDRAGALRRQRELVEQQRERLASLRAGLDAALAAAESGKEQDLSEMFDGFDPKEHHDEARERWGGTPEYEESMRRVQRYGAEEWKTIHAEHDAIATEFAALMEAGADPSGPEATDLARRHREHISRWYYECSPAIHRGLGEMYVADPRFTKTWDKHAPGLAAYVRDAILAA
ncbi:MAG: MerR family transcriptional regulator, thiopeptide resistance regulator [Thermoleophilaceae bacterium]|nr:MerR family transcriptional regulator, thiopeptide resistance regulator [Thermoleophilaceae bacterium]